MILLILEYLYGAVPNLAEPLLKYLIQLAIPRASARAPAPPCRVRVPVNRVPRARLAPYMLPAAPPPQQHGGGGQPRQRARKMQKKRCHELAQWPLSASCAASPRGVRCGRRLLSPQGIDFSAVAHCIPPRRRSPECPPSVPIFEFDSRWHGPLLQIFAARELTDVVIKADGVSHPPCSLLPADARGTACRGDGPRAISQSVATDTGNIPGGRCGCRRTGFCSRPSPRTSGLCSRARWRKPRPMSLSLRELTAGVLLFGGKGSCLFFWSLNANARDSLSGVCRALTALVDFAYTGELELAGSTVTPHTIPQSTLHPHAL